MWKARAVWVIVGFGLGLVAGCQRDPVDCENACTSRPFAGCVLSEGDLEDCPEEPAADADDGECEDRDGDGFSTCGFAPDCDDSNDDIHPAAEEFCDVDGSSVPIDNDCDGVVDEDNETGAPLERRCPRQAGICIGSTVTCVEGRFPTCAAGVGYPVEFEEVEVTCDGVDNSCEDQIDENCCPEPPAQPTAQCTCRPGQAWECGSETGTCTRGVRVCQRVGRGSDGLRIHQVSDCVEATLGDECESDADCDEYDAGFCVRERWRNNEGLFDMCDSNNPGACDRSVCRYLTGSAGCENDEDCAEDQACVTACSESGACTPGVCRPRTVEPLSTGEVCNGLDDNCDGRIDDDGSRLAICGPCPLNMVLVDIVRPNGSEWEICVDQYEASRPDASATDAGVFEYYAASQPGVLPWTGLDAESAAAACDGTAYVELFDGAFSDPLPRRRPCWDYELAQACGGDANNPEAFPYGDAPVVGACWDGSTGESEPQPTGSREDCCRFVRNNGGQGVQSICDASGNVAEWALTEPSGVVLVGGSYVDGAPTRCDRSVPRGDVPTPYGDDVGFRCCTAR